MKKILIVLITLILLLPSITFAKSRTFKAYLSVGGEDVYKDSFASALREGFRKYDDIVFVNLLNSSRLAARLPYQLA
jgi:cobalamin biosynthesis protein CbiG